jgi:hypothetical protein
MLGECCYIPVTMTTLPSRDVKSLSSIVNSAISIFLLLSLSFSFIQFYWRRGEKAVTSIVSTWNGSKMVFEYKDDVRLVGNEDGVIEGTRESFGARLQRLQSFVLAVGIHWETPVLNKVYITEKKQGMCMIQWLSRSPCITWMIFFRSCWLSHCGARRL